MFPDAAKTISTAVIGPGGQRWFRTTFQKEFRVFGNEGLNAGGCTAERIESGHVLRYASAAGEDQIAATFIGFEFDDYLQPRLDGTLECPLQGIAVAESCTGTGEDGVARRVEERCRTVIGRPVGRSNNMNAVEAVFREHLKFLPQEFRRVKCAA